MSASVSVVIPTAKSHVRTLDSVPDSVETHVVADGNRAEARNIGARQASGEVLVFCDDDIAFGEAWFRQQVASCRPGEVRGLADFEFGLLLTRFLVVHRDDWRRVGEFDAALNHMEDTEWCLRAQASGLTLRRLSRDAVEHEAHDNDIGTAARVRALAAVVRRHPGRAGELMHGVLA